MIYCGESKVYQTILLIFHPLMALFWRPKIRGTQNIPCTGGAILVSNHRSFWDPVQLAYAVKCRQIHFMAKSELFQIKIIGWFLRKINGFPVNRHSSDITSIKNALQITQSGNMLGIFPQGTRRGKERPFQKGAASIALRARVPIVPAYMFRKNILSALYISFGKPIDLEQLTEGIPRHEKADFVTAYLQKAVEELGASQRGL